MTLIEAITKIDALKPNTYSQSEKVKWLSMIDGIIKNKIIDTHEGGDGISFNGYDENTNLVTELLVPAPYDDIYVRWLETRIDYTNGEYDRYNNGLEVFNEMYDEFNRYYNRTHMPLGKKFKFF
jgi:hypothetical protein